MSATSQQLLARVERDVVRLAGSPPGPDDVLAPLRARRALPDADLGPDATPAMRERAAHGRLASPLPYPMQRDYHRGDAAVELPALRLGNGLVTATVLPSLGGRVHSLHDHGRGRELLHLAPRLRFASFGLTDAWFAGGIEWNLGSTGHSCLSSRPVHAAVLRGADGSGGDVLRLWEWERTRDLVLQVDLSLAGDRLLASTRVLNPDPEDKPLYYWTNVAVPETPGTRVLCPAACAWRTDDTGGLRRVDVPFPDDPDVDISRPLASTFAADYFYDVAEQGGRHVVAVEPDGVGLAQTATAALTGRKLFLWGHGAGGTRWQEWLGGPGARYCEIQAGLWPTQLEHGRLPGGASVAWTEAFGAVELSPSDAVADYGRACAAATQAVWAAVDPAELDDRHERWRGEVSDRPPDEIVATGSGWGSVELELRGAARGVGNGGLPFPEVDDDSAAARAVLRDDAAGLERTADRLPVPPVSSRWTTRLGAAREHWWVHHALAVGHHVRGETAAAGRAYERSLALHETAGALRGLAVLAADDGEVARAAPLYDRAREVAPASRELVTEQLELLLDHDQAAAAIETLAALPDALRRHGRTRLLQARALTALGRTDEAAAVLDDLEVPDLAEGETALTDLWAKLHPDRPAPGRLDFRMAEERTTP